MTPIPSGLSLCQIKSLLDDPAAAAAQTMELLKTMQTDDEELRSWAGDALQSIAQPPVKFASQLAVFCGHEYASVAGWACKLLGRMKDRAAEFQDRLVTCLLTHCSISARQDAAAALRNIFPIQDATIAGLQSAAQHNDPRLSRLARATLAYHASAADTWFSTTTSARDTRTLPDVPDRD